MFSAADVLSWTPDQDYNLLAGWMTNQTGQALVSSDATLAASDVSGPSAKRTITDILFFQNNGVQTFARAIAPVLSANTYIIKLTVAGTLFLYLEPSADQL